MIDKRYGKIFRQIREQKELPLSYFEKYGVLKSNLARFERGETMMGFERVITMLQGMNISLSDYELFFNYYLPDYQEHFLYEVEIAEFGLDENKLKELYDKVSYSGNRLLSLSVKSKITMLSQEEVEEILNYLYNVKHWGYFELSLNCDIVEYLEIDEIKNIVNTFEKKVSYYYDVMKYRRKIHQIAYRTILHLCLRDEELFAEELLEATIRPKEERLDFFISTLRKLVIGCKIYHFQDKKKGLLEINQSLSLLEDLGSTELKHYYTKKIQPILDTPCHNKKVINNGTLKFRDF